ncbi:MAG: hypothetical protein K2G13_08995 [Muribaculaceae bacterium]|nr:hypothetical protein [Muribaculaceae bacterium]
MGIKGGGIGGTSLRSSGVWLLKGEWDTSFPWGFNGHGTPCPFIGTLATDGI